MTLVAVALAIDQDVQSKADQLKEEIQQDPQQFAQIENLSGQVTLKLEGIRDQTTFFDRMTGRRRLVMFYSAVAKDGPHSANLQGIEQFAISFGSSRQVSRDH